VQSIQYSCAGILFLVNFRADLRRLFHEQPAGATALRALDTALRCASGDIIAQTIMQCLLAHDAKRHASNRVVLNEVVKPWSLTSVSDALKPCVGITCVIYQQEVADGVVLGGAAGAAGCVHVQIQHDFNRNKYFNPQEALEYGLVDRVIKPPRTQALGVS